MVELRQERPTYAARQLIHKHLHFQQWMQLDIFVHFHVEADWTFLITALENVLSNSLLK